MRGTCEGGLRGHTCGGVISLVMVTCCGRIEVTLIPIDHSIGRPRCAACMPHIVVLEHTAMLAALALCKSEVVLQLLHNSAAMQRSYCLIKIP